MKELDKFADIFNRRLESVKQAQLRFVTCKSIDWDNKTMTAEGVSDDVNYDSVQLGFGYIDVKPAIGSVCLIGILEGKEALTFLINAEEVEMVEMKVEDKIEINGGKNDGLVKVKELTQKLNSLENQFNTLLNTLQNVNVALAPSGTFPFLPIFSAIQPVQITDKSDIENDKIKH
jgi:hypothetical protein